MKKSKAISADIFKKKGFWMVTGVVAVAAIGGLYFYKKNKTGASKIADEANKEGEQTGGEDTSGQQVGGGGAVAGGGSGAVVAGGGTQVYIPPTASVNYDIGLLNSLNNDIRVLIAEIDPLATRLNTVNRPVFESLNLDSKKAVIMSKVQQGNASYSTSLLQEAKNDFINLKGIINTNIRAQARRNEVATGQPVLMNTIPSYNIRTNPASTVVTRTSPKQTVSGQTFSIKTGTVTPKTQSLRTI